MEQAINKPWKELIRSIHTEHSQKSWMGCSENLLRTAGKSSRNFFRTKRFESCSRTPTYFFYYTGQDFSNMFSTKIGFNLLSPWGMNPKAFEMTSLSHVIDERSSDAITKIEFLINFVSLRFLFYQLQEAVSTNAFGNFALETSAVRQIAADKTWAVYQTLL